MRWLLLPLGLAIAAVAVLLLQARPADGPPPLDPGAAAGRAGPAARGAGPPREAPMGDIDEASRRALERVLEREGIER